MLTLSRLEKIENALDRGIGVFAPKWEIKRRIARQYADKSRKLKTRSQYAAAKTHRLTGDWLPANTDINSLIKSSSAIIRARTRQLIRDFPYFKRAINILADYVVGDGIVFQSRIKTPDGKLDKKTSQKIEDAVKWWMDDKDASGKLFFFEFERLAKFQDVETGEYLFVKKWLPKRLAKDRYTPFALQAYEADWLTDLYVKPAEGTLVDQGIEYDTDTGQVIAYHFMVPDGFNPQLTGSTKTVRVKAENVIHGFETLRPSQLRGISPFTTAILIAHDLSDYLDAEVDGAKMAAKYLAFIKTNDMGGIQASGITETEDDGKKIEELENCILQYLRSNEEVTIASHNRPGNNFEAFVKFVLQMVAIATNTSYELLSGNYEGINYSSLRGIRNDLAKSLKAHSKRHILHFSRVAIFDAITAAVMVGKLDLPGYFQNPRYYHQSVFIPPGMESIDPLREGKAWIEQIGAGLRSPQEIVAARGRDYKEVLREIAEAKKMADELGIPWLPNTKGTAMQQNPAKLGASENAKK